MMNFNNKGSKKWRIIIAVVVLVIVISMVVGPIIASLIWPGV